MRAAPGGENCEFGVERFVLDDGWFGKRDDDTTSLGDWDIDPRKYPDGLKPLVDHVTGLGMQFGIWFEPEMVNPVSELYKAHPDWALTIEGRPILESRTQLVLDLTRPEVSDYLFGKIDAVLCGYATTLPHLMLASLVSERLGIRPAYAHGMQMGGATGAGMVMLARELVRGGRCRRVLGLSGNAQ